MGKTAIRKELNQTKLERMAFIEASDWQLFTGLVKSLSKKVWKHRAFIFGVGVGVLIRSLL